MRKYDSTQETKQGAEKRVQCVIFTLLLALLTIAGTATLVMASDVSDAKYRGQIKVSNNGTVASNVFTVFDLNTQSLIDTGKLNATANDTAIQTAVGVDVAFMPSVNATYPWATHVSSIGEDQTLYQYLFTSGVTGGKIRYFPGDGGMTTANSTSLEPGDNFTIEQKGWVDTSSGDAKLLVDKSGAFRTFISNTEEITSLILDDKWVEVAPKLGAETSIYSLAVYNDKLYGGTGVLGGSLYEWNGSNLWVSVAPKLGAEVIIFDLVVYNDKLYGGTYPNGKLYEWDGVDEWVEVAPKLGDETCIFSLAVYNDKLYGGTGILGGSLYEWNGSNLWVSVAPKLGAETSIYDLAVYNDKLYGGTSPNGKLYEWDGVDEWVEVAPKLGAETRIVSLAVYNDKLYGGTYQNGRLYEWNGIDAWVEVATKLGAEEVISSLAVYNGKLYGGTADLGNLYEWNGSNKWVVTAPPLGTETNIFDLAVYNDNLYGGTFNAGKLHEYATLAVVTATGISSSELTVATTANITHMWIDIDGDTKDTVALGGVSVPDESTDWLFLYGGVMPYMEYQKIWVGGVLQQHIEGWEYGVTQFNDKSGGSHNATPTFRIASSDPDVSAELVSFLGIMTATPPPAVGKTGWDILPTVPDAPEGFFTELNMSFWGAGYIQEFCDATDIPLPLVVFPYAFGLAIGSGGLAWYISSGGGKQHGRGSLLAMAITTLIVMIYFVYGGGGVIPAWVLLPFGIEVLVLIVWRQTPSPF